MRLAVCRRLVLALATACVVWWVGGVLAKRHAEPGDCRAPVAVWPVDDGERVLVLGSATRQLVLLDSCTGAWLESLPLPGEPSGLAIRNGAAYIATNEPSGRILVVDLEKAETTAEFRVGHGPISPVISVDGEVLCVANRFDHTVSIIDPKTGLRRTVEVVREPIALAVSKDGKRVFVANHLPEVRPFLDDENPYIGAEVSVM